jgi:hypothetical protein
VSEWARLDSNQRPLVCKDKRSPLLSYSPFELRDKDSNLDLRVQSAASWPLDDPGMDEMPMSRRVP